MMVVKDYHHMNMGDFELSTANLPVAMNKVAEQLGGEVYESGSVDGFSVGRDYWPRNQQGESYIRFKALRQRKDPDGPILSHLYALEEGVSTYLDRYPDHIQALLETDDDDEDEDYDHSDVAKPRLWVTDATEFSYAYNDRLGGTIVLLRTQRYGLGSDIIMDVPIISKQEIIDADLLPLIDVVVTDERDNTVLKEYKLQGVEPEGQSAVDSFDSIVGGLALHASRLDECLQRMAGMLMVLGAGGR